jgi:MFS family permease
MGVGAFVWIPLSLAVGRRPVFLLCTIILLLATMLAVVSGNLYMHLVSVCLQGLSVGISSSTVSCLLDGKYNGFH